MRRKFTYKDVSDWKVVDINGKSLSLAMRDKEGKIRYIERWDGYRSARVAAYKLGGSAVRA